MEKDGLVRGWGMFGRVEAGEASSVGFNLRKKSPEKSGKPISEVVLSHHHREGQKPF